MYITVKPGKCYNWWSALKWYKSKYWSLTQYNILTITRHRIVFLSIKNLITFANELASPYIGLINKMVTFSTINGGFFVANIGFTNSKFVLKARVTWPTGYDTKHFTFLSDFLACSELAGWEFVEAWQDPSNLGNREKVLLDFFKILTELYFHFH